MRTYTFTPFDTLFFRDGRPFNLGELGNADIPSQFPPPAPTLVGALRAALARNQGWAKGPWKVRHKQVLGDGPDLAGLSFSGPFLLHDGRPLFPAPLCLLGVPSGTEDQAPQPLTRLAPGPALRCDIDKDGVRFPIPEHKMEGMKDLTGWWVTLEGMNAVLSGGLPDSVQLIHRKKLWAEESRVGLGRDAQTRIAAEGQLYFFSHVRVNGNADIRLAMQVDGLPENWQPVKTIPLGGEGRLAGIEEQSDGLAMPGCPHLDGTDGQILYTAYLATPMDLDPADWPKPNREFIGLPGKLVSACVARPLHIGGWDSEKRKPLPLRPLMPAGTVLFMSAPEAEEDTLRNLQGTSIGKNTNWGFGKIFIGTWKETKQP